eukprot:1575684-Pleurochrysis_carterae.AAC.2
MSCARPRAKRRSSPVLISSMPLKGSRNSGIIFSVAQMSPGRNSAEWLRFAVVIAEKAADTKRSTAASPVVS